MNGSVQQLSPSLDPWKTVAFSVVRRAWTETPPDPLTGFANCSVCSGSMNGITHLLGSLDTERITEQLWKRVADGKAVLGRHTPQARQMLRKLLDGKILMEPIIIEGRHGHRISGSLNLGRLLPPEIFDALRLAPENNSRTVVAPTGFEPVFQP